MKHVMVEFFVKSENPIFAHFCPFGKMRIFLKNRAKKLEKTNEPILRAVHHRQTDNTFLPFFGPFLP